jgi:hypothetical protein
MTTSDNLTITHLAAKEANAETTVNAAIDRLDLSNNDPIDVSVAAGGTITLTSAQKLDNILIRLTGAPGSAVTLDVPDGDRALHFESAITTSQPIKIETVTGASDTIDLQPGQTAAIDFRGTDYTVIGAIGTTAGEGVKFAKDAVRVATVADGTLATAYEDSDTVDGITIATGDRILIKDQSTGSENGIYTVNASGAPTRASDFDDDAEAFRGATVAVIEGDVNARTTWMHTTSGAITLDTTALTFEKMVPVLGKIGLDLGGLREIVTNDIDTSANHGGILTSDSTPDYARVNGATDKALRVNWPLGNVDEVQFSPVFMPPDLDEGTDLTIHLLADMSGATDTPTIDVQVFDAVGDTEMGGATAALSSTLAELTVTVANANISGNPLGFLNIALVPGTHGTDALRVYAAWIEYTRKSA